MNAIVERAHAKLSASGSEKWMTCTPSAHLEEQFPDEQSEYAEEGTFAHEVFEYRMSCYLDSGTVDLKRENQLRANKWWSHELSDYVQTAVDYAIERIELVRTLCADPVIMVEQRLDFSQWVPEGFGTGDLVIIADGVVEVLDLKYGKGVPVDAKGNSQMRLYGLGGYTALAHLYDIQHVRTTVLQPRLENFGSEMLTVDELLDWANTEVVPKAKLAWTGEGVYVAGDHCSSCFCRARFTCAARQEQAMAIAKSSFALVPPELLTVEQIASVLDKADLALKWINDVKDFALKEAERGVEVPGFKLVEGRSNRKYIDQDLVAQKLTKAGIEEAVIYERSLLGITAMEKAIGKKQFAELLSDLVEKPQGKPVLVPESDKRPALTGASVFSAITEDRS